MGILASIKTTTLDLLFPLTCAGCRKEGVLFCPGCRSLRREIPPSCLVCKKLVPARKRTPPGRTCASCRKKSLIYAFISPFSYSDKVVRDLVHSLKYNRVRALDAVLAELIYEHLKRFRVAVSRDSVIIPVPLYKSRERVRGFNQAELIARALAERIGAEVEGGILQKIKKTKPQIELGAEERRRNIIGSFSVKNSERVRAKTILLLDDVKTTGATLEEAARVLKEAGAKRVWAITVAH